MHTDRVLPLMKRKKNNKSCTCHFYPDLTWHRFLRPDSPVIRSVNQRGLKAEHRLRDKEIFVF